jgi:hypothetical protein
LLRNDTELALEVARNNWSEFHKVGDTLLADRDFMLQALQCDGWVLRFAASVLRQDYDILVMAVANHYINHSSPANPHVSPPPSVAATFSGIVNLTELDRNIQAQLELHQTFLLDFLCGIAINPPHIPPPLRQSQ